MSGISRILTVNSGSSSIKFALFELDQTPKKIFEGAVEDIGSKESIFYVNDGDDNQSKSVLSSNHSDASVLIGDWLKKRLGASELGLISHRIVHGGPKYFQPALLNSQVIADLETMIIFDPEHLPIELALVKTFSELFHGVPQTACFDTNFHSDLPSEARLLPIPRRYQQRGLRRYGFHGLSCEHVIDKLKQDNEALAGGRLIIAHLGSGVSLTAVRGGKSIDTTMGLTPASGVPMSNRSGDLDPGLALYLAKTEGLGTDSFAKMASFESGLLGLSETTADMKKLLKTEDSDEKSAQAVNLFCYQVKKAIGGLAASLGGLDTLVFTGGMGENAPKIRSRVCTGMEHLGIKLDDAQNNVGADVISASDSRVNVQIIRADEATQIAKQTAHFISGGGVNEVTD